ncbi:MAG: protein-L-isoaspartate O-methyltransferase [Burkholderiales bacterium]|nr:protein-L-isoaspartate O-methyltransferase [Burkholderiales bacterium]
MDIENARYNMVEQQIRPCNVSNKQLLETLIGVKRETFILPLYQSMAFFDVEIQLPNGYNMLCPRVDAMMIQNLDIKSSDKILEVGTGSGYVTCVLSKMAKFVYSFEIDEINRQFAVKNITYFGANNVSVLSGNGLDGMPSNAPFDKILVSGAVLQIPETLKQQLAIGGSLICITGNTPAMCAMLIRKVGENKYIERQLFETVAQYLTTSNMHNKFIF